MEENYINELTEQKNAIGELDKRIQKNVIQLRHAGIDESTLLEIESTFGMLENLYKMSLVKILKLRVQNDDLAKDANNLLNKK